MKITIFPTMSRFAILAVVAVLSIPYAAALDKNGNFESKQEQNAYIAVTLKKMASEMNSQAPIQLDEDTRMMSVIALQKTITFNMRLVNYKASQVDPSRISQVAKENLNHTVCKSKATRDLIDLGVQYVYLYSGNDGMLVTRVVIDKYRC
ncbi:MAG: type II secretion system pilot lipoprotein GspS-beta [Zoogloea sp.]|nr:type II secretion system pilot lipoprotein GspS-beta [Zoogloea sp.]